MLPDLHWLRSPECIDFKLAVLICRCLDGLAPRYLSDTSSASPIPTVAVSCRRLVVILAASDPTYMAVHCWRSCVSGGWKLFLEQYAARRHLSSNVDCFFFGTASKLISLPGHFQFN